jgi:hypothetical protein
VMILVYLGGARNISALTPKGQSLASPTVHPLWKISLVNKEQYAHMPVRARSARTNGPRRV